MQSSYYKRHRSSNELIDILIKRLIRHPWKVVLRSPAYEDGFLCMLPRKLRMLWELFIT